METYGDRKTERYEEMHADREVEGCEGNERYEETHADREKLRDTSILQHERKTCSRVFEDKVEEQEEILSNTLILYDADVRHERYERYEDYICGIRGIGRNRLHCTFEAIYEY